MTALCLTLAGSASVVAFSPNLSAEEPSEPPTSDRMKTAMRETFSKEFRYVPKSEPEAQSVVAVKSSAPAEETPVVLENMSVVAHTNFRQLDKALHTWHPPTEPRNVSTFGTGVHEKDIGKVRLTAVTVLYIPIFLQASW